MLKGLLPGEVRFFFSGTAGGVQDPESPKSFAGVF